MNPINPFSNRPFATTPFQGKLSKSLSFRPYFNGQNNLNTDVKTTAVQNDKFEKITPQDKDLSTLENRNVLFSSNSIRSQLDYFIRNPKSERLVLPFNKAENRWDFGKTKRANILIKKNTLQPPAVSDSKAEAMTSWYIQPIFIEPLLDTLPDVSESLKTLSFNKTFPQGQVLHFAWQPKLKTLIPQENFITTGIEESAQSPLEKHCQKLLETTFKWLTPIFSFLSINHEGYPQIGNQTIIKPEIKYHDKDGIPYQHLSLIKTGDDWHQVKTTGTIQPLITSEATVKGLDKRHRRKLLDNLMNEVSKIEADGYQTENNGHLILKSEPPIDENPNKPKSLQIPSGLPGINRENPFMLTTPIFKAEVLSENKTSQVSTPDDIQDVIKLNEMVTKLSVV